MRRQRQRGSRSPLLTPPKGEGKERGSPFSTPSSGGRFWGGVVGCLFVFVSVCAGQQDVFDKVVRITKNKATVYELLKDVSDQSGYLFIYDSRIVDNDKKVTVKRGNYPLRDAIYLITGENRLKIDVTGVYILLRLTETESPTKTVTNASEPQTHFTVNGFLFDSETETPVIFASVTILNSTVGTITNQDGEFQLKAPDSLLHHTVRFSHIGFENREIELALLKDNFINLGLNPSVIPLQEVVVSPVYPELELKEMLNHRAANYASEPVYLTTFYREGIEHNNKNIDLTESVLQIYKTGYRQNANNDQVKLIKKRRIANRTATDTIFPKMRSGINSCLILDIIKELPEFVTPDKDTPYAYSYAGKSYTDDRQVNIISFQQKERIREPLYCGELLIEAENKALVEARFEINARHVNKATHTYITKKPLGIIINLQQAKYIVSYKPADDGHYHIHHIRGDIHFKIRRRNRIFNSPLHFWFEMATCDMNNQNVKPFPQNERLSTTRVFAETQSSYDRNFWENFNIILPEEGLKNTLIHNLHEILVPE